MCHQLSPHLLERFLGLRGEVVVLRVLPCIPHAVHAPQSRHSETSSRMQWRVSARATQCHSETSARVQCEMRAHATVMSQRDECTGAQWMESACGLCV
jgi:hypothetical protein